MKDYKIRTVFNSVDDMGHIEFIDAKTGQILVQIDESNVSNVARQFSRAMNTLVEVNEAMR
jgi:hypothetical protein